MISLDQVLLLQKKVETAVEKISFLTGQVEQLKNDNDALREKCAELTKSLDEKTELVTSLESDQGKIEEGILTALNRLDTVENTILNGSDDSASSAQEEEAEDDTPAFDYTGSTADTAAPADTESQELKEVTEEIEQASPESQDVQLNETSNTAPTESDSGATEQNTADSISPQFDIF